MASIAQPTRSARCGSIANRRDAAMVSIGRSLLPPPMAAWRIASNSRSRPSPVGASSRAKKLSTSARTRAASAFSSPAERSIVSTGIERLEAGRFAVAAERNLLNPRLRILQTRFAVALQPIALLIEFDRTVERRLAFLQRAHDLLEPRKRSLEAQLTDVLNGGHDQPL